MARYLYTVTAVALVIFYVAVVVTVNAFLRLMSGVETDLQTRQALATGLGVTVVAGPLWWLHWRGLCWQVGSEPTSLKQQQYRIYLAAVVGFTIFAVFISAGASVTVFMRLALGLLQEPHMGWTQGLPWLIAMVTATTLWGLHWQPLVGEGVAASRRTRKVGQPVAVPLSAGR